ncbi:hypothetical protein PITC_055160 [Penicillium italicum]|uniref:Uncharacterized protein n=1 Tax=Penicillium italicum TaxID=40296 RepID=A0A0A2L8Y1_PENIT|nr:hypothetical protein PITC_055160 [Penicillium italicum]
MHRLSVRRTNAAPYARPRRLIKLSTPPLLSHRRVVAPGPHALTTAPPFWPVVELGGGYFGAGPFSKCHA